MRYKRYGSAPCRFKTLFCGPTRSGAVSRKRGRFERAHNGTIFLDEIGELPADAQVRLLRVLQDKEIERIGGSSPVKLDIRVIAATHRNLESMLAKGRFREDLYFRLKVFPIALPPLRNRREDIPGLVQHFIRKKSRDMKLAAIPELSPGALGIPFGRKSASRDRPATQLPSSPSGIPARISPSPS